MQTVPFAPPETIAGYGWLAEPAKEYAKREAVGKNPRGIRYASWPFCFEEYVGDTEPDLEESRTGRLARNRWILWKRVSKTAVPSGWRVLEWRPWRIDGVFALTERPYQESWNADAIRNSKRWRRKFLGTEFSVEPVTFGRFCDAYKKSTVAAKVGTIYLDSLSQKRAMLPAESHPELWGVRRISNGEIVAGVALHFFAEERTSVHECPFMLPSAGKVSDPTGLDDHWFAECVRRRMRTLVTPYLWRAGDPSEWIGPSDFKTHFGFQPVEYPPTLIRFVRGKLV